MNAPNPAPAHVVTPALRLLPSSGETATSAPGEGSRPPDNQWFNQEIAPHVPSLRAFLRSRFPSLRDIDDLMQESISRLLRARSTGMVRNSKTFLFSTARNAAVDLCRHNQILQIEALDNYERLPATDDRHGVVESVCRDQELACLHEAIANLPPRIREAMTLCRLQGLSRAEAAARMGISEATLNIQINVGLLKCRRHFVERGIMSEDST